MFQTIASIFDMTISFYYIYISNFNGKDLILKLGIQLDFM